MEKLHDRRNILEERFRTKQEKLTEQLDYLEKQQEIERIKQRIQENSVLNNDFGSDATSVTILNGQLNSQVLKIKVRKTKALTAFNKYDYLLAK